jgi:magnesium transporter
MLRVYAAGPTGFACAPFDAAAPLDDRVLWLDLLRPDEAEIAVVEKRSGLSVPSVEDLNEIELSSRLYVEDRVRYMTVPVLVDADTSRFRLSNIAFIHTGSLVVTVRHDEPTSITNFATRICRAPRNGAVERAPASADSVLVGLVDAIIDRTADIIERVGGDIDRISRRIFGRENTTRRQKDYMAVLHAIGQKGDLLSLALESLVGLSRMVSFLSAEIDGVSLGRDFRSQIKALGRDADSLREHAIYLGDKITFLLDAVVGMVTIEQNNLVKIFSVVSVILMPPTLIASTYGMNFEHMPELSEPMGYPLALLAMLVSAVVPFLIFRWKKWL